MHWLQGVLSTHCNFTDWSLLLPSQEAEPHRYQFDFGQYLCYHCQCALTAHHTAPPSSAGCTAAGFGAHPADVLHLLQQQQQGSGSQQSVDSMDGHPPGRGWPADLVDVAAAMEGAYDSQDDEDDDDGMVDIDPVLLLILQGSLYVNKKQRNAGPSRKPPMRWCKGESSRVWCCCSCYILDNASCSVSGIEYSVFLPVGCVYRVLVL